MSKIVPPKPAVKAELTAEESTAARKAYYAAADAAPSASTLQVALDYVAKFPQHYLFPVAAGAKTPPCGPGYAVKASNDPKVLARMHAWRPGCSWLLAPGKSDVVVIDADLKKGKNGRASLDMLELLYGKLPRTSVVISPSGGKHFRYRATNRVRHIFKLNFGGELLPNNAPSNLDSPHYTIIPGVRLANGFYKLVDDTPLALAPDWLADVLGEDRQRAAGGKLAPVCELDTEENIAAATELLQHYAKTHPAIQGQGGDSWTFQVACQVGDLGVSESVCLDRMFEFFNPWCIPLWNADHEEGSSADRLSTKVRSAYTSRETPVGIKTAEAEFGRDPLPPDTPAELKAAELERQGRRHRQIVAAEMAQKNE